MLSDRKIKKIYTYLTNHCMQRGESYIYGELITEIKDHLFGGQLTREEWHELYKVVEKFVKRCDNVLTAYLEEKFAEYIKMNAIADNQQLYECFKDAFQNTHVVTRVCLCSALDKLVQKGVIREVPANGQKYFQIYSQADEPVRIYQSTDPFICTKIESEEIDINDL